MISFEIATKKNKRKQLWKTVLLASCLVFTLLVSGIFALRIFLIIVVSKQRNYLMQLFKWLIPM
jgi:hypothetical protein